MDEEIGFDGVTVREAIASRTLQSLEKLLEHWRSGALTFEAAHIAVVLLLEATFPFCDPTSKEILSQVQAQWTRESALRVEAGDELSRLGGDTPGTWG